MNADGTDQQRIYHSGCCVGEWSAPIWSPDGTMIAFAADSAGGVYAINADGSGLKQLIPSPYFSGSPSAMSWQPRPALAAVSARPKPGHYGGPTSEDGLECSANYGNMGCKVTFRVVDHGKRVTGFTTEDGYNGMCDYVGNPPVGGWPHIFQYLVKMPPMKVRSSGSFTSTSKASVGPFTGTFRVKGRFSSGTATGTITRLNHTCDSLYASNPTTSDYLETFTAKRTKAH
jgi:hypothetical protein